MTKIVNNKTKGKQAEFMVSNMLSRIFDTNVNRHSGDEDKGIDLSLKFESPINNNLFDINFQIKTGLSYVEDKNKYWRIINIEKSRFEQWKNSTAPVILIWVDDTQAPITCYWTLISYTSSFNRLLISKKSILSPATIFEVMIYLGKKAGKQTKKINIRKLLPKIYISMRDFSKSYFKKHLLSKKIINPVLGEVEITWNLWNHLTRKCRKKKHILFSLELIPIIPDAISYCNKVFSIRKVNKIVRGNWTTDIKLIIFRINHDYPKNDNPIFLVIRETIIYPNNWINDLLMTRKIQRHLTVESIYRKE